MLEEVKDADHIIIYNAFAGLYHILYKLHLVDVHHTHHAPPAFEPEPHAHQATQFVVEYDGLFDAQAIPAFHTQVDQSPHAHQANSALRVH